MIIDEKLRWYVYWTLDVLRGGKVKKYYNEIRESYKKGTSIAKTDEKIQKLIAHAVRTTKYYSQFPEDIALKDLPVVNKDTFRAHYDDFLSEVYKEASDNRVMWTSGSTGTPFSMVQNRDKINHNTAASIFLGAVGGYYIGMKQAFVRVWMKHVKKGKIQQIAENLIMMDSSIMGDEELEQMVETIRKKKVKVLLGYANSLAEISRYIKEKQIDTSDFCVRAIIPMSEPLALEARESLKEQFGCDVRAWFANEENGVMGIQNPQDEGYYIETESYYYEILKLDSDEPAEPGELGRIVITDLYNYAFPILRYDNGDLAIAERKEKNGRYRLYLKELYGRRSDIIYDCKGRPVTPVSTNMWNLKGVQQFRFIQEDVTRYTMMLNGNPDEIDEADVIGRLKPFLGEEADIRIEYVDEIPVLNSGKRKFLENRCKLYTDRWKNMK